MDDHGRLQTVRLLACLGRTTRGEIAAFRDAQLRRLLAHAYEHVPYYRRQFDRLGVRPADVSAARDLARLPTTSRKEIQAVASGDQLARGLEARRLVALTTAGTSARPLTLYRTRLEERLRSMFRLRVLHDMGVRLRDRQVGLVMSPRPGNPNKPHLPQRVVRALGLFRRTRLDLRLGLAAALAELRRLRPDVLLGYPSVLARVLELCTDADRAHIRPRLVLCGAEVLTPLVRAQIARGFGAQVRDWYGTHEVGLIAWECTGTGLLHVAEHNVVLEVVRDGHPVDVGAAGEAVVTSLQAFAMPFVRYRLGDLVTRGPDPCPCGAPFSTLVAVDGRVWERIELKNGRAIHAAHLNRLVQSLGRAWIGQYQLVHEAADTLRLRITPLAPPESADLTAMRGAMAELCGPGVGLEIHLVPDIEPGPNGKFQQLVPLGRPSG